MNLSSLSTTELQELLDELVAQKEKIASQHLHLDMARGKPHPQQVELSYPMLSLLGDCVENHNDESCNHTYDILLEASNYGNPLGILPVRELGSWLLGVPAHQCIASGSSSLNLMFDCITRGFVKGWNGNTPHCQIDDRKFICLTPGYDRHFALTEYFGYENIAVEMSTDDLMFNKIEQLVSEDPTIKGIWCVPKYSNPTGMVYSDEMVKRLAHLKPAAPDFKIYWDNAYGVHDVFNPASQILNIFDEIKGTENESLVIGFASTSKITIPGSGVAFVGAYGQTFNEIAEQLKIERVCPDKINQLAHTLWINSPEKLHNLMKEHAKFLSQRFSLVQEKLKGALSGWDCSWTRPQGGYFVTFRTPSGQAKQVVSLARELGVTLTDAGATYPYGDDQTDQTIRIAPSYPDLKDLSLALDVFVVCVKLVAVLNELDRR